MSESVAPALDVEILTLFPELFASILSASLLGKAVTAGIVRVERTNFRDFAPGKHRSVDDAPYGGGAGMLLRPEPIAAAIDHVEAERGRCHRVFLSPQGRLFNQTTAATLVERRRLLLVCGRYEGFDHRLVDAYADDVLSIGDYILSGGELAAAVVLEACSRLVPGVLGSSESLLSESFADGRLEYPQYTRPPEWRGRTVPEVLLSGDHAAVAAWRAAASLQVTEQRRPDLLPARPITAEAPGPTLDTPERST